MTHKEFCEIEWTASRAMNSIKAWSDKETKEQLNQAAFILAEVRNAAMYLCDKDTTHHEAALKRLGEIFTMEF